ncbi:histidinol-phosphate transaminase [Thalassorhabdus alkalitolerans]|uniref:Histidinol-phosphate aminotransferase n=1 Tax=Thalassorhabdus alkalitolerans TaxID=2282697 RepID=A0ABW0YR33_9BACI|nr:histidinol-phosphate transaminase [Thalassobacillus sp. C254]
MKAKKQVLGLTPYKPGKPIQEVKEELGLDEIIKLASNENPFGPSPKAKEAMVAASSSPEIYPDGYAARVREAVAKELGVEKEQLIFGAGSDEVILMLCRTFLTPETNTVMAAPTFSQYKHNAIVEGTEIREVPLTDGVHDLDAMLKEIDEETRIVWVCNPNNPSGTYNNEEDFLRFLKQVPKDVLVVSDEAYIEYVTAEDYPNTIELLDDYPNLMVLRTFSKAYGLAALRIGFGVASRELIRTVDPVRPPFNTTVMAHEAAIAALQDKDYVRECHEKNKQGLKEFTAFCKEEGLYYYPSQANFLLINTGISGDVVFDSMLKKGFILRSGEALGFPNCVRITVGDQEQNRKCMKALKETIEEAKTVAER